MELRTPDELASQMRHNYLKEINAAFDVSILDWKSSEDHRYELVVGRITITVTMDLVTNARRWRIVHENRGLLSEGSSESLEVAKVEALKYAEHWVRNGMVGVLA